MILLQWQLSDLCNDLLSLFIRVPYIVLLKSNIGGNLEDMIIFCFTIKLNLIVPFNSEIIQLKPHIQE